jgi:hypothetical protein
VNSDSAATTMRPSAMMFSAGASNRSLLTIRSPRHIFPGNSSNGIGASAQRHIMGLLVGIIGQKTPSLRSSVWVVWATADFQRIGSYKLA